MKTRCYGCVFFSFSYNRAHFEEKQGPGWLEIRNMVITLSFGRLHFRPECVVILGDQGLHGLMFLILISRRFAFFKRLISAKPECSRGGGGSLFFSACVGWRPATTFHPQKYQEFQAPKRYFTRAYVYIKISEYPPPSLGSYTRWPSESDKTGVMKIATKECDIDNDVIVYIVIGNSYQLFQQSLSIKQSKSRQL